MDSVAFSLLEQSLKQTPSALLEVDPAAAGDSHMITFVYGSVMIVLMGLVAVIYWSRGLMCCARIMCYLLAISTMTLTVKNLYTNHNFKHSKFLSCTHFVTGGMLCFGIMMYRKIVDKKPLAVPSIQQFGFLILPIALAFASSIGANNMALIYSNAAFVEMVAACGPICTVLTSIALGMEFGAQKWLPVAMVSLGMVMCATGELTFSMMGFGLAFYGALARSVKATLQHKLMASDAQDEVSLDPIELLAWMCIPSFIVMYLWSIFTEGVEPYEQLTGQNALGLIGAILLTCFNACVLNVSNLFVIKDLGAVATQLCATLKGILIVLGGMAVFGETVTLIQGAGFAGELGGVFWYNKVDEALKKEKKSLDAKLKESESKPLLK